VLCIGTLALRFSPLELLPLHQSDWFLQFRATACIRFTPPLRRSPSAQSSGTRRTCPRLVTRSWFRRHLFLNDASSYGFTFVRLSDAHLRKLKTRAFPPTLTTTALDRSSLEVL